MIIHNDLLQALEHVPRHMRTGVLEYVLSGRPTGSFLRAVLENNLHNAAMRADEDNRICFFAWAAVLDAMPLGMWGSKEKVDEHLAMFHAFQKVKGE